MVPLLTPMCSPASSWFRFSRSVSLMASISAGSSCIGSPWASGSGLNALIVDVWFMYTGFGILPYRPRLLLPRIMLLLCALSQYLNNSVQ